MTLSKKCLKISLMKKRNVPPRSERYQRYKDMKAYIEERERNGYYVTYEELHQAFKDRGVSSRKHAHAILNDSQWARNDRNNNLVNGSKENGGGKEKD